MGASKLEPWEYRLDHPAFRRVSDFVGTDDDDGGDDDDDDDDDEEDAGTTTGSPDVVLEQEEGLVLQDFEVGQGEHVDDLADHFGQITMDETSADEDVAGASTDVMYVEPYIKKGKHVYFTYDQVEYKTSRNEWEWDETMAESGNIVPFCQYRYGSITFWTYMLPSMELDEDYEPEAEGKGKGKGRGKGKGKEEGQGKGKGKEGSKGKEKTNRRGK